MKKVLLLISVFFLASCEKDIIVLDTELDRLASFRTLWESNNIDSYEMTQESSCFCASEFVFPKRLRIEDKRLVAVNGGPFEEQFSYEFLTIDEAFDFIEDRLLQQPAIARIFYDGTYGFPYSFYFDMDERIADEEIGFSFSDFYLLD